MCHWFPLKWKQCPRHVTLNWDSIALLYLILPRRKPAYEHLFEGLLSYLNLEEAKKNPRDPYWPISNGPVCQDLYLHSLRTYLVAPTSMES